MSDSRKRRLLLGILAKGFGQGGQVIIRLVEVPLYLAFWGASLYGEWLILVAVPFYLSLSDFGFAGATNRHMTILMARGQQDDALASFRTSFLLVMGLSSAMALAFWLLIAVLPLDSLFGIVQISRPESLLIVAILGTQVVLASQTRLLFGGFLCVGRYPFGFLLISITDLLRFGFAAIVVLSGGHPVDTAWAMLAGQIVGMLTMRVLLYRVAPWFKYGFRGARLDYARELLQPAISAMAFPIGEALSFQGTRLIIALIFGPIAVTAFVAHRQLARLANLVATLSQVFQSELSNAFGREDLARFRNLSRRFVKFLLWLIALIILPLAVVSSFVFDIWTRGEIAFDALLFALLMIASVTEAAWRSLLAPTIAINKHAVVGLSYLVASFLLLPAVYLGSVLVGLDGAAIGLIFAELTLLFVTLREMLNKTGDTLPEWVAFMRKCPIVPEKLRKRLGI